MQLGSDTGTRTSTELGSTPVHCRFCRGRARVAVHELPDLLVQWALLSSAARSFPARSVACAHLPDPLVSVALGTTSRSPARPALAPLVLWTQGPVYTKVLSLLSIGSSHFSTRTQRGRYADERP